MNSHILIDDLHDGRPPFAYPYKTFLEAVDHIGSNIAYDCERAASLAPGAVVERTNIIVDESSQQVEIHTHYILQSGVPIEALRREVLEAMEQVRAKAIPTR